jgi:hypothetical protein
VLLGVGLCEGVLLGVALLEGVCEGVSEIVPVREMEGVLLGVIELVAVGLGVPPGVPLGLGVMLPDFEAVGVTEPVPLGVGEYMQLPTFEAAGSGDGEAPSGCEPTVIDHVRPKLPTAEETPSTTTVYVPAAGYLTRRTEARKASTFGELRTAMGQGEGVGFTPHAENPKAAEQPLPVPAWSQAESSLSCTRSLGAVMTEPSFAARAQPGRSWSAVSNSVLEWQVETSSCTAFAGTVSEKSASALPALLK